MGSNITPDEDYLEEALTESTMQPSQNVKSTLFPLTYYR
jgi:hypothetical protein